MTPITIAQRAHALLEIANIADAKSCVPDAGEFMRETATVLMLQQMEVERLAATLRDIANAPGLVGVGLDTTGIGAQVQRWAAEAIAAPEQPSQSRIILPNG